MMNDAPAIPRLGVPAYDWWNEACTASRAPGAATVFPQAIGMAATFDTALDARGRDGHLRRRRAPSITSSAPRTARALPGPHVLVAEHQHLPRSALGPRPGDLRRGSVPDRRAWASPSSTACRATTRSTSRSSRRPSTTPSTAGPSRSATASTSHPSERDLHETYLPAFQALVAGGARRVGHGRLQPRQRRVGLRQRRLLQDILRKRLGLPGLRRLRLRRDRRHLHAPQDRGHAEAAAALGVKSGLRSRVRHDLSHR